MYVFAYVTSATLLMFLQWLELFQNTETAPATVETFSNSQIYFWNITLHVSDSSSVHHQFFTVHTAMVYVIQLASIKLLANLHDI